MWRWWWWSRVLKCCGGGVGGAWHGIRSPVRSSFLPLLFIFFVDSDGLVCILCWCDACHAMPWVWVWVECFSPNLHFISFSVQTFWCSCESEVLKVLIIDSSSIFLLHKNVCECKPIYLLLLPTIDGGVLQKRWAWIGIGLNIIELHTLALIITTECMPKMLTTHSHFLRTVWYGGMACTVGFYR